MKKADKKQEKNAGNITMKCENIQSVLFDYMSRELGAAHTHLIREHLRKCDKCKIAAAEIQATLEILRNASAPTEQAHLKLSKKRRKRIYRAFMHPIWDWININHFLVSIIIMVLVIAATILIMRKIEPWHTPEPLPDCIPVNIQHKPPNNNLTPLIEEEKNNSKPTIDNSFH